MNSICSCFDRIATKLVRATMEELRYFLSRNEDFIDQIKILHLLRDPRGRLNSNLNYIKKLNKKNNHELDRNQVSAGCARQMKDVRIRKQLEKQFPKMFLEIRYEDVASNPVTMATHIYQLLYSLDVPDQVKTWIRKNTSNGGVQKTPERRMNTFRRNSTATSVAWKHELSEAYQNIIEKECKSIPQHLNLV